MKKKMALITLVSNSLVLSDKSKLDLIKIIPSLDDNRVIKLGQLFATEQKYIGDNAQDIIEKTLELAKSKPVSVNL
jgi:hypothetical protein